MDKFYSQELPKSDRIPQLVHDLYAKMPEIESARAVLITESYKASEGKPMVLRRSLALNHILQNIPIIIRPGELIVGSTTLAPRGCQTYPEFSWEWLQAEFDTVEKRDADPFYISEETKRTLREVNPYWKGKTSSELADAYMTPETHTAINHNIFTTGNYYYNGIGHYTCQYEKVLNKGLKGVMAEAATELSRMHQGDGNYARKSTMLQAVILSCQSVIDYAARYSELAKQEAAKESDPTRKKELLQIAENCAHVPGDPARTYWEALQSFWFIQQVLQIESSGHSISPGRFDQYINPFFVHDLEAGTLTREFAQELLDCVWVKFNDLNKCRDAASARGFAGYSLFQNLIVGGQDSEGRDATNDVSFMCITASKHVFLPMPSLSIRFHNGSNHALLIRAADLTRTGIGFPAYYNDEAIIPAMMNRGASLVEARNYSIIGCVEPQVPGVTDGWHDAAFFNMCRPLELVFSNGYEGGERVGIQTGTLAELDTYDKFFHAYEQQMEYLISLMVNSDNAIDVAHATLCPNPLESCLIGDCMQKGLCLEEGGAQYNFTGPQGFGIANVGNALYAIKHLVYDDHKFTLEELAECLRWNYGQPLDEVSAEALAGDMVRAMGTQVSDTAIKAAARAIQEAGIPADKKARMTEIWEMIKAQPKYGNDNAEVDEFARQAAYCYSKPCEKFTNPRGGQYQAGMYPVSANVPLGEQTGATPDGRLAHTPVADGVSPFSGTDTCGPTAVFNSVAKLDHMIASNGTLLNMKFHPSALTGLAGLENFVSLLHGYFDQKAFHVQFNVVDRKTLLDAQAHPENYQHLVVRVAGYSALFTTLSKSLQDDIIARTEQMADEN